VGDVVSVGCSSGVGGCCVLDWTPETHIKAADVWMME
jgi:hypothetical protein